MDKNGSYFDIWRVARLAIIISLAFGYVVQWKQMISSPVYRTGTDFIHFYAAGQIAQRYGISSVYKLDLQRKIEEEVVGFPLAEGQVLPYNHIPYLIPLLQGLISDNYVGSFARWIIILIILYAAGNVIFIRSIFSSQWNSENLTLLGAIMTFYPFFVSILLGQDTAFLYFGAGLWCMGILKKNDWLAGLGLALTTIRPQICLLLAIPVLFHSRKVWWRFFIIASGLAISSSFMLGLEGIKEFINVLLVTAGGNWYGTHQSAMMNLLGLMLRVFPFIDEHIIRSVSWVGYVLGIGLISVMWLRTRNIDERLLGTSIIASLFFAPHLHYHDLTLLVLPILLTLKAGVSKYPTRILITLFAGISFVLFISSPVLPLYFILPYILYLALVWVLWRQGFNSKTQEPFIPNEL